jgi:hypothetical protein
MLGDESIKAGDLEVLGSLGVRLRLVAHEHTPPAIPRISRLGLRAVGAVEVAA